MDVCNGFRFGRINGISIFSGKNQWKNNNLKIIRVTSSERILGVKEVCLYLAFSKNHRLQPIIFQTVENARNGFLTLTVLSRTIAWTLSMNELIVENDTDLKDYDHIKIECH